eukprot:COSAG02_NODE_23797_length_708_cov_0.494253_2_plen_75_part_01
MRFGPDLVRIRTWSWVHGKAGCGWLHNLGAIGAPSFVAVSAFNLQKPPQPAPCSIARLAMTARGVRVVRLHVDDD